MAVNSASALDALFIQYHEKVVAQQFPQATPFLSQLKEGGSEFQANQKGWKANAYLRQDASNAWGVPGMDFPAGTTFVDKNFYIYRAKYAKSHEIDGSTYNDLKLGNEQTLLNEMGIQNRLMMSAAHEQEQAALGDGTGKKCVLTTSSTTTTLYASTTPDGTHAAGFGVDFVIEGGKYDIITSGSFADASHQGITLAAGSISRSANTITVSALGAAPNGGTSTMHYYGSYNQYPKGLRYLIDGGRTGSFQNLDASVEPYLNSSKTDAGGQDISVSFIQNLMLKHVYANGGEAGMQLKIFGSPTQIAGYQSGFWNQVRFTGGDQFYEFNTDKAKYNGTPFQSLVSIDPDVLMFVDMSDIRKLVGKKLSVHSEDGLTWRQKTGANDVGSDNWYINYGYEGNYAILSPRKHAILVNLGVTGLTTGASRFGTS